LRLGYFSQRYIESLNRLPILVKKLRILLEGSSPSTAKESSRKLRDAHIGLPRLQKVISSLSNRTAQADLR